MCTMRNMQVRFLSEEVPSREWVRFTRGGRFGRRWAYPSLAQWKVPPSKGVDVSSTLTVGPAYATTAFVRQLRGYSYIRALSTALGMTTH